jgi:alpha-ketoglutarate-dependent taurine dioxygenase
MKISKIPGLGRFGTFIDDVDFDHITDEEWMEIGRLHLNSLVTIIRNVNLSPERYQVLMQKWGTPRDINASRVWKKYQTPMSQLVEKVKAGNTQDLDDEDIHWIQGLLNVMLVEDNRVYQIMKVTGRKNEKGEALGMFAEGELLWHSNESGNLAFTPGVSLLAKEGVVGSATGFLTTTDWYEEQSNSFRSELDDMIVLHKFSAGKISPGLRKEQDFLIYKNTCPVDNNPIPLVIQSPAGIKGLHYSVNTVNQIQGMSEVESQKLFERINKELFVDRFIYDHWYQNDNDLCLFDNSITIHRRLGGITNRLCYRIQHDYSSIQSEPYVPYFQKSFAKQYKKEIREIVKYLGITDFKLPQKSLSDFIPFL